MLFRSRLGARELIDIPGEVAVSVPELVAKPQRASTLLSCACMRVFGGDTSLRSTARALDYLAYGLEVSQHASLTAQAIMKAIGDQEAGDLVEPPKSE